MGCHALLQRLFLPQGWNLSLRRAWWVLLHGQVGSLPLVAPGMPVYTCPLFLGFPAHLGHTEDGAGCPELCGLASPASCSTSGCCASGCGARAWAGISLGTPAGLVRLPLCCQFLPLPIRKAGSCPSSPVARSVLPGPPAASLGEPAG